MGVSEAQLMGGDVADRKSMKSLRRNITNRHISKRWKDKRHDFNMPLNLSSLLRTFAWIRMMKFISCGMHPSISMTG